MRRLLVVPFEETATREEVPTVVAKRNLRQVRLNRVTVPHEVLSQSLNYGLAEREPKNVDAPAFPVDFRIHEQRSDATAFLYPLPSIYYDTWSCAVVTASSRCPNKGR